MELRQTSDIHEKISGIINNRNLKDYSCFIGVKTRGYKMFYVVTELKIQIVRVGIRDAILIQ